MNELKIGTLITINSIWKYNQSNSFYKVVSCDYAKDDIGFVDVNREPPFIVRDPYVNHWDVKKFLREFKMHSSMDNTNINKFKVIVNQLNEANLKLEIYALLVELEI